MWDMKDSSGELHEVLMVNNKCNTNSKLMRQTVAAADLFGLFN